MAAGSTTLKDLDVKEGGGHKASGLYAHVTWHTWRRLAVIRECDVPLIHDSVLQAAHRTKVRVHAQAVLRDHVHVVVSYAPDATLSSFVRDAKSESARRINSARLDAQRVRCAAVTTRGPCRGVMLLQRAPTLHGSSNDTRT